MSHPLGRKEIIEFLVYRKFPPTALATLSNQPRPKETTTLGRMIRHEEISQYRSELESLPFDQLQHSTVGRYNPAIPQRGARPIERVATASRLTARAPS